MLGSQTKEVDNYILMHMAQGVGKSTLRITLGVELFTRGVWLFENFTLCNLHSFEAILGNTFLDAYK
jgi:hypothetical protein